MGYEQILFETESNGIATITLNRPERLNAFTGLMHAEMLDALESVEQDDDSRVTILTGAGRGFCAGLDLASGADTFGTSEKLTEAKARRKANHRDPVEQCLALTKPVIVAINGPAVGVGVSMILPFDIRLAAESARIGLIFNRRGILPELACRGCFRKSLG